MKREVGQGMDIIFWLGETFLYLPGLENDFKMESGLLPG